MIKSIFGEYFRLRIKDIKLEILPSKRQKEEIRLRKEFYSSFLNKNDLCFDIGANTGNRIGPLLHAGAKVVAVEPQEECCKFLNFKFGQQIEIVKKGVGESNGIKDFYVSNSSKLSSFSTNWIKSVKNERFKNYSWDKTIKVEMTTLDSLIEEYDLPKFIKIDVEGFEPEVLKGLTKPVELICFEYAVPVNVESIFYCIDIIEKNNPHIECNYCIGESMVYALSLWKTTSQMKEHVITQEFIDTDFGDMYIRIKS